MTVVNVSSTALYVNWTMLPLSTDEYRQLLGYELLYWKESNESQIFNKTFSPNENHVWVEDLEKWTVYCFAIAGFTYGMPGLNYTQCARTFEDGTLNIVLLFSGETSLIFGHANGKFSVFIDRRRNQFLKK